MYYIPENTVVVLKDSGGSVERLFIAVIIERCCQILRFLLRYGLHPFSVFGPSLGCF